MNSRDAYQGFSSGRSINADAKALIVAERFIIGAILADNARYALASALSSEDFEDQVCGRIFDIIRRVMNKEVASMTRIDAISCTTFSEVAHLITPARLHALVNQAEGISDEQFSSYVNITHQWAVRRRLTEKIGRLYDLARQPDTTETAINRELADIQAEGAGANIKQSQEISIFSSNAVANIAERARSGRSITGIATGYPELDTSLSGLCGGKLYVIAGRPAMGKTSLALNMSRHASLSEKRHGRFYSLEMSGDEQAERFLSDLANIDSGKLRNGALNAAEWERLARANEVLSALPIKISDEFSNIDDIAADLRRAKHENELDYAAIDYLQLIECSQGKNRQEQVSYISRTLKRLASELKIPIIVLSQLNRSLEARQDKRPVMSDLRESGAIEQDADVIMFVYRDVVYNPATPNPEEAEIIIGKQRGGATGTVKLRFHGATTRFENPELDETAETIVNLSRVSTTQCTSNSYGSVCTNDAAIEMLLG